MRIIEDVDKTKQSLLDGVVIYQDFQKQKEDDGKVSLVEGGVLFVKHSGKALRFVNSLREIGEEMIDADEKEVEELIEALNFSPKDPLVKSGISKIAKGSAQVKEGIRDLIEYKNQANQEEGKIEETQADENE